MVINALKAEIAERLTRAGKPPLVLSSPVIVGAESGRARLFESAYDEHAQQLAKLYETLGLEKSS